MSVEPYPSGSGPGLPPGREPRPRFAQLTFTTLDRGQADGGWGVQQTAGEPDAAELRFLTERIVTRSAAIPEVGAYLSPEQARGLPSRLVYAPGPSGVAAWWHTVPCGLDGQGRPGNAFVHVVLDRAAGDPAGPPARPSDLAWSPCWLRPFGSQVGTADLGRVDEPPWDAVPGRAEVLEFLRGDRAPDAGVLSLLLDAVHAAVSGGPTVALGLGQLADAPLWIATVAHLTSPGIARRLYWSTSERLAERNRWPAGVHLVAVPQDELVACGPLPATVLLAEDDQVRRAGPGGPPRSARHGVPVEVTAWSVLAYELAALLPEIEAVLARLDDVAEDPGANAADLDPGWPLGLAVLGLPVDPDIDAAALEQVLSRTPTWLPDRWPELYARVLDVVDDRLPPTTGAAWDLLCAPAPVERRALLRDVFLLRALADEDWLAAPGRVDAQVLNVVGRGVAAPVPGRAADLLDALYDRVRAGVGPAHCVALATVVARLADLLAACWIVPARSVSAASATARLWAWVVADVVLVAGRREEWLAGLHGVAGRGTQEGLRRALADRLSARDTGPADVADLGRVLALLDVRLPSPDELRSWGIGSPLVRALAAVRTLGADVDAGSVAWLVRVWDLLDPDADPAERARLLTAPGRLPPPEHLVVLLDHPNPEPVLEFVRRAVLRTPNDPLEPLVRAAGGASRAADRGSPAADALRDAAELRSVARERVRDQETREVVLDLAVSVLADARVRDVDPTVWDAVHAAYVGELCDRAWGAQEETVREALPTYMVRALREHAVTPDAAEATAARLADDAVPGGALVLGALLLRADPDGESPRTALLRAVTLAGPDGLNALDLAVRERERASRLPDTDREEAFRRFRQELRPERPLVRRLFADRADGVDQMVRHWWETVTGPDPDRPRPARSP